MSFQRTIIGVSLLHSYSLLTQNLHSLQNIICLQIHDTNAFNHFWEITRTGRIQIIGRGSRAFPSALNGVAQLSEIMCTAARRSQRAGLQSEMGVADIFHVSEKRKAEKGGIIVLLGMGFPFHSGSFPTSRSKQHAWNSTTCPPLCRLSVWILPVKKKNITSGPVLLQDVSAGEWHCLVCVWIGSRGTRLTRFKGLICLPNCIHARTEWWGFRGYRRARGGKIISM